MKIDAEASAALEELVRRWGSGEDEFVTIMNAADDLEALLLRMESEPEGEQHDGSCDFCGLAPTLPRHVCRECWGRLERMPRSDQS